MKKFIIIFIIVLLGAGGYWYFFMRGGATGTNTGDTNGGFKSFFSFGNTLNDKDGGEVNPNGGEVLPGEDGTLTDSVVDEKSRFRQVTDFAVSGLVAFMDTRDQSTSTPSTNEIANGGTQSTPTTEIKPLVDIVPALRFVARANGHIYGMYIDSGASDKISNTTIPTTYEALFSKDGNSVIYRYLDSQNEKIQSFTGTIGGDKGGFLPENISAVAIAPSGSQFFYLAPLGSDVAGYIGSFADNKRTQIFSSSFTEWLPQWTHTGSIYLTTKPSGLFAGSLYSVNKSTGGFIKIFGGVRGLTTLASSSSNNILYTDTSNGTPSLGFYNIASKTFSSLGVDTISDKCVWSSNGQTIYCAVPNDIKRGLYPDDWYQGSVAFKDTIVRIDVASESSAEIFNTEEIFGIDGVNLTLSNDEKVLFIVNKTDGTLWSLDL